ncbi:MAG: pantoate--beta-alanine ligase [Bacteroidetes bacterium]|nr:pantoate--beta-alanine ligase [Bacteroidota bacterium]
MLIIKTTGLLSDFIEKQEEIGLSIGFVPTMGALHAGHISLITQSKSANDLTVCSVFVNPTQFNNKDDFNKYPITIEADIDKLEAAGCDVLFLPSVDEIYPPGIEFPLYELGYLETILEGKYRPGHYQGVCKVVDRLLSLVKPTILYLGQKDYQQCMVIKKMMELRNIHAAVHISETIREKDGLAMSSRNTRLSKAEREQAVKIYETLTFMKAELKKGSLTETEQKATDFLTANGFKVDYASYANANTLELISNWNGTTPIVILIAAYLDEVRLIDNFVLN